ncbi:LysM peptidoglycan-binding domain-containing protein [Modicisalibacter luteus]|uniref:LysM peptidoglycan-binding domain-containing protein n=1 Tax=Modicisalibacter luteus TaxID=453962 RepID=A0ABV7M5D6_9GAMM|nr:LysM peptidoglycan-binding domain-containing protein [Halomonas lutea]GHA87128.1 lytic transglycosylase [Halomonas lutea]
MSDRSTRRQAISLASGFILSLTTLANTAQAQPEPPTAPFWDALLLETATQGDIWQRLRDNFQWQVDTQEPRVQEWIDYYRQRPGNVTAIAEQARPWLYWVISELERRNMPAELALLPFIESAYDPAARHPGGATGMWQLMPGTGDALGLRRDWWYDGRLDVIASTKAALDYLQQQADRWYDGDLELALAAYNAGPGRVNQARREAVARGKPGDYWHLHLPNQTMDYVPKLLALSRLIAKPSRYGIALPSIPNQAVFARVSIDGQFDLAQVADLADVSLTRLKALNPGLLRGSTLPEDSPDLLIPRAAKETVTEALLEQSQVTTRWAQYRVRRGDTLSVLASRYSVSVPELRRHNNLRSDVIRVGQVLRIPDEASDSALASATNGEQRVVQVRAGDSLSRIAARHDVTTADLIRWNQLDTDQYLQPGQLLTLYSQ